MQVPTIQIPIIEQIKTSFILNRCERSMQPLPYDSVELSPKAKLENQARRIYSRSQRFKIEDYEKLTKLEKSVLRETSSYFEDYADENIQIALKVKEKLDKYHGENQYIFCCIGTSPAPLARTLEFMGVETKYIPISGLRPYYESDIKEMFGDKFPPYQKFLDEQGLSASEVKNSNKQYLFYDYLYTGKSLDVFKRMMKEHFGLDSKNVSYSSVDFLCYSSCAKKIDPPQYAVDYVEKYMRQENAAKIGGIAHLPISQLDKINECKNFESLDAKMYNFALIDKLSKKGILKNNPNNKNSL